MVGPGRPSLTPGSEPRHYGDTPCPAASRGVPEPASARLGGGHCANCELGLRQGLGRPGWSELTWG